MARYQYRVAGAFDWMSNSGNALVVVANPVGSGKKLTIRSMECTNLSAVGNSANYALYRSTVSGGTDVIPAPMDSSATWPSTVHVLTGATSSSPGVALRRWSGYKQLVVNGLSWLNMQTPRGVGKLYSAPGATVEGYVLRAGESIAMKIDTQAAYRPTPIRVSARVVIKGTPDRTFTITYFADQSASMDDVPFALKNDSGSGLVVELRSLSVEEVGTTDTPYLQLVPVGSINADSLADPTRLLPIIKMDSDNPSPSSWLRAYKDVPLLPLGMPENALSDASAGSPKNVNYLKTKYLLGPVYRVAFPEQTASVGLDTLGGAVGHHNADLLVRKAGIVIREGEGIALVSAAESATGAFAVPTSGWMNFNFGMQIDVEPKLAPTLTLTGLQNPTEVRVFSAGTTTQAAGQENVTSGTFTWQFDPDAYPSGVDIAIISLGYLNARLTSVALPLADVSIPIQQSIDRQYQNI